MELCSWKSFKNLVEIQQGLFLLCLFYIEKNPFMSFDYNVTFKLKFFLRQRKEKNTYVLNYSQLRKWQILLPKLTKVIVFLSSPPLGLKLRFSHTYALSRVR